MRHSAELHITILLSDRLGKQRWQLSNRFGFPPERSEWGEQILAQETQGSRRAPVRWLSQQFGLKDQNADELSDNWLASLDLEIELLKEETDDTDAELVYRLLKFYLVKCQQSESQLSTFEPLQRMVDLHTVQGGELRTALTFAITWSTLQKQWQTIEQLENRYEEQIRKDRLLLYLVAEAADRRGDAERAQEIAERAFGLKEGKVRERYEVSSMLAEVGRHDWAEREWQYLIDQLPVGNATSFAARGDISGMCFFDRGEYQKAADTLAQSLEEIDKLIQSNDNIKRQFSNKENRLWLERFRAQQYLCLAFQAKEEGNIEEQEKHLEAAYKADGENPDVLIAMHRMEGANEEYRRRTSTRIKVLCKKLESQIKQSPRIPRHYNHWAWLVGNTEGDFEKAIDFSHRSMEIEPEEAYFRGALGVCYQEMRAFDLLPKSASYLDTLGRCYFAAGDLEKAIEYQRQAIELHPHLLVMRRQLEMFEKEAAKK